jgi:hypothetical protein
MKATIQIDQTLHVGSTQLAPGEYLMSWTESGSNAEVTFSQGKEVIATVPAQATHEASGYAGPAIHINTVSNTLTGVALPKVSLSFNGENPVPTNPGIKSSEREILEENLSTT